MVRANPGLRPGLSSAVPAGLDLVMAVLTQPLKPSLTPPVRRDFQSCPDTVHQSGGYLKRAAGGSKACGLRSWTSGREILVLPEGLPKNTTI